MGALWTLQGLDILGGSVMSGATRWVFFGIPMFLFGILLSVLGCLLALRGGKSVTH